MPDENHRAISELTLDDYRTNAEAFRDGTRDHDVSQNIDALLRHIEGKAPLRILDLGCGPGRDLKAFTARGHIAVGLDGAEPFVTMARAETGCEVLHQNLLELDLPAESFDGIFANAVLFHLPSREIAESPRGTSACRGIVLFQPTRRQPGRLEWRPLRHLVRLAYVAALAAFRRIH